MYHEFMSVPPDDPTLFSVRLSFKNKRLDNAVCAARENIATLAGNAGMHSGDIERLIDLRLSPFGDDGKINPAACRLAELLGFVPEALFPPDTPVLPPWHPRDEIAVSADELAMLVALRRRPPVPGPRLNETPVVPTRDGRPEHEAAGRPRNRRAVAADKPVPANPLLADAIGASRFGSVSALAQHMGCSYNTIKRYVSGERHPIDRRGVVKRDIATVCRLLGRRLEELFPPDVLGAEPLRFPEDLGLAYIKPPQGGKPAMRSYTGDRAVNADEAAAILGVIDIGNLIPEGAAHDFVETVAQRLTDAEFDILRRHLVRDQSAEDIAADRNTTPRAVESLIVRALKALNSPKNLHVLKALRDQEQRE